MEDNEDISDIKTYADYLNKYVTKEDLMYLEDEELARKIKELYNTQNVTDMSLMFDGCNSLKKKNIITKDKKILDEFET